jgi:hypothetical protein
VDSAVFFWAGNWAFPCKPDGNFLSPYRIATTPVPSSDRLTSFKSTHFDRVPADWAMHILCGRRSYRQSARVTLAVPRSEPSRSR